MVQPATDERHQAEVNEINAKTWHWRMAALKELSVATLMIMFCVMVYLIFERLWPLLPK
jgi:hypothetical protein